MKKVLILAISLILNTNLCFAQENVKLNGRHKEYYPNTKIVKTKYKLKYGQKHGFVYNYDQNGKLLTKEKYFLGKKDGFSYDYSTENPIKKYYENNVLIYDTYKDKETDLIIKKTYKNNTLVNKSEFLKDGRIIENENYNPKGVVNTIYTYYPDINTDLPAFNIKKADLPEEIKFELEKLLKNATHMTEEVVSLDKEAYISTIFDKNKILMQIKGKNENVHYIDFFAYGKTNKLKNKVRLNTQKNTIQITEYYKGKNIAFVDEYKFNQKTKQYDIKDGTFYTYNNKNKLTEKIIYKNNKAIEEHYTPYYPNGNPQSISYYINGKAEGEHIKYYENRQIKVKETYLNGELHGPKKMYYENGNIQASANLKNGKINGKCIIYHKNGNILSEGNYSNGKKHGNWKTYYEDGSINAEEHYLNDKKHGTCKEYWENGSYGYIDVYNNGELKSRKSYNMYGKELWSQKY